MTIEDFAARHRVRIKRDEEGETIVLAKSGPIYGFSSHRFGVMFMLPTERQWNSRRRECERAGMTCIQDGDTEGTLLFDPENRDQAKTAIKLVGARQKRQLSPEARKLAIENAAKARQVKKAGAGLHSDSANRP
jgi:hypothetical protein